MYATPCQTSRAICHYISGTLVTFGDEPMTGITALPWANELFRALDPRRSLGRKVGWFVACLSFAFASIAALWLGSMTRTGLLQQHCRQLTQDAEQLANTLDLAMGSRVHS